MKQRYRLYRRDNGVYYSVDNATRNHFMLGTKDGQEASKVIKDYKSGLSTDAAKLYPGKGEGFTR